MLLRKIAWGLTLLCMAFIFFMSARPVGDSRTDSARLMTALGLAEQETDLYDVSNTAMFTLHIRFRKMAHVVLYAGLGALYFASLYGYFGGIKRTGIIAVLLAAFYGATDEIHQIFTQRGASLNDVMLDAFGGLLGVTVMGIVFFAIQKNKKVYAFFNRLYDFKPGRKPWKKSV